MQAGTNFSESFTSIYGDDIAFLEKTIRDFPVSPLPVFLLLQKYKQTHDERFDELAKKTSLYFPNPSWLKFQLSLPDLSEVSREEPDRIIHDTSTSGGEEKRQEEPEEDIIVEEKPILEEVKTEPIENAGITINDTLSDMEMPEAEVILHKEPESVADTSKNVEIPAEAVSTVQDFHSTESPETETEITEEPAFAAQEEISVEDKEVDLATPREKEISFTGEEGEMATNESPSKTDEGSPVDPTNIEIVSPGADIEKEETETFEDNDEEVIQDDSFTSTSGPPSAKEENDLETADSENKVPQTPATPSAFQDTNSNDAENEEIAFEPLHTVDYFASQGIIIKEESLLDDKLGKQMKSFTDWLKSMKKLHPGKLPEQNQVVEQIIQSSAELSNEDAGVLTEAMAEVLVKQGKRDKAIEMYEKLSLMNPPKSTYFAAKIENLKN